MTELRRCVGYDPTEEHDRPTPLHIAKSGSVFAAVRLQGMKHLGRYARAAEGHMPFDGHRTCAATRHAKD